MYTCNAYYLAKVILAGKIVVHTKTCITEIYIRNLYLTQKLLWSDDRP